MVRVLILGQGMVGTTFAVGVERLKRGEISPSGIPLANVEVGIPISDIRIVGAVDIDARKVGKTIYQVAKQLYKMDNVPSSLSEVNIFAGLDLDGLSGLFPTLSLEDKFGCLARASEAFLELLSNLSPDVIVDVTTTQHGEPIMDWADVEKRAKEG